MRLLTKYINILMLLNEYYVLSAYKVKHSTLDPVSRNKPFDHILEFKQHNVRLFP
jgi:hypothetical protein